MNKSASLIAFTLLVSLFIILSTVHAEKEVIILGGNKHPSIIKTGSGHGHHRHSGGSTIILNPQNYGGHGYGGHGGGHYGGYYAAPSYAHATHDFGYDGLFGGYGGYGGYGGDYGHGFYKK